MAGVPDRAEPDGRLARLQYFAFCYYRSAGVFFSCFFSLVLRISCLKSDLDGMMNEWQKSCDFPHFFRFHFLRVNENPAPNGVNFAISFKFFYQKTSTGNTSWEPPTKPLVFATRNRQPLSKSTLGGGVPDFEVSISQQKIIYQDLLCQEVN